MVVYAQWVSQCGFPQCDHKRTHDGQAYAEQSLFEHFLFTHGLTNEQARREVQGRNIKVKP